MKKIIRILSLCLCTILIGCSNTSNKSSEKNGVVYQIFNKTINFDSKSFIVSDGKTAEQLLYICADSEQMKEWKLFVVSKEQFASFSSNEEILGVTLELEATQVPMYIFESYGNDFYVLASKSAGDKKFEYFLSEFRLDGTLVNSQNITEICSWLSDSQGIVSISAACCDTTGEIILAYSGEKSGYLVLNENLKLENVIPCQGNRSVGLEVVDEKIYTVEQIKGKDTLFQLSIDKCELRKVLECKSGGGYTRLASSDDNVLWISVKEGIKTFDTVTSEVNDVFSWSEAGISGDEISELFVNTKGQVGAVLQEQSDSKKRNYIFLSEAAEAEPTKVKETITIGIFGSGDNKLQKAVGQFNTENPDYHIQVQFYEYDSATFGTELITGGGPDLIPLALGSDYMAKIGIVEDLTPYLENSQVLGKELLNEKVLALYTVNDVLTAIPPTFYIKTLMGRASELGEEDGWTTEEFLEYIEANKGCTIFEGSSYGDSRGYLVWHYLWSEWDNLIDYESGQANFDTQEFKTFLSYAKDYKSFYDLTSESDFSTLERVRENQVLLLDNAILGVEEYLYCKGMLEGDIVAIGEPSSTGTPKHGIGCEYEYGINSGSEHKEGAWAFIEYLILMQEEEQKNVRSQWFGFPTYLPAFEVHIANAQSEGTNIIGDGKGNEVLIAPATDEEISIIKNLINKASYLSENRGQIENIVAEEISNFLNGIYDVDGTVEVIQNRVQLYLDEMK